MKLARDAVRPELWQALEGGAVVHRRDDRAWYRLTGTGRIDCLQGLVTCDVAKMPDESQAFGALLTAKGMIVAPLWIVRRGDALELETPLPAAAALEDVLARSLPPRLCRWERRQGVAGVGLYGAQAARIPAPLGAVPAVVRGAAGFDAIMTADRADAFIAQCVEQHVTAAGPALLDACRIFAGIPALGAEIDDKTLPQEVRFDELSAVSYTKGCYLGQETVARVHFRGHPNRRLVFLLLDGEPGEPPVEVRLDDKVVGRLTSTAWSSELDAWAGAAVLRREVEDGATVQAGETTAVVRVARWPREP